MEGILTIAVLALVWCLFIWLGKKDASRSVAERERSDEERVKQWAAEAPIPERFPPEPPPATKVAAPSIARGAIDNPYWIVPEEFVVVDLETTGFSATRNKIIEIGALKARREQLSLPGVATFPTYQALVKITSRLPPTIVTLTGLTDEMLRAEGIPLDAAIKGFREFCGSLPLVAYNARFDKGFIDAAADPESPITNEWICALATCKSAFPGLPSYRLATVAAGIDAGQSHRAVADCHRALIAYIIAAKKLGEPGNDRRRALPCSENARLSAIQRQQK